MSRAMRDVYGEALVKLGGTNPNVVALDADVASSTKSILFQQVYPERFFNVGIAEANMVAMAAGLATTGKIPFVNTFAVFISTNGLLATRELVAYMGLNVKLMGAYGGLSDSYDGPTHHSIEDFAILRTLPGFRVWCPSDACQTAWMVEQAAATEGPVYIRLSRDAMPDLYDAEHSFTPGKAEILREGGDLTIIACGVMTSISLAAAETLAKQGIETRVVDMFSLKPLDEEVILDSARKTGAVLCAEEHSAIGGLGSAVSGVLCRAGLPVRFGQVALADTFAECGPYDALLAHYGLDETAVVRKVRALLERGGGGEC